MPEETTKPTEQINNTNFSEDDKNKRWKGLKQDAKSGKYIVYITESSERLFDDIDSAVDYMVKAGYNQSLVKTAGSPEFSGVERGQKNIDGVKQVQITRKLVQDKATGQWKVKERVRTDVIKEDDESAKEAYKNIDQEKLDADEIKSVEEIKQEDKEQAKEKAEEVKLDETAEEKPVEKESSYDNEFDFEEIAKCSHCGCNIYPYSIDDATFDRESLANAFCPSCGYGLGEAQINEQSLDNLIKGYK